MELKTCCVCKVEKDVTWFSLSRNRKDGHHPWCKPCVKEYRKLGQYDRYSNRTEYFKNWQKEYRKTDKAKTADRTYRKQYTSELAGLASRLCSGAKNRAKNKNIAFCLDLEWVKARLEPMKCEVSGVPLLFEVDKTVMHSPFRPSIDRIDNSLGYTKENSRIVAVIYNKAKSDGTDADVLKLALGIVNEQKHRGVA
jgi:hypothetical protein